MAQSSDVYTVHELIEQLARTISCGGNFLLNVGPDMHGKIPPIFEDRLRELGRYTSRVRSNGFPPDRLFNPQIEGETSVYAWILNMPTKDLELKQLKTTDSTTVSFLGTDVTFKPGAKSSLTINFERIPWRYLVRNDVMVLKIENAASQMVSILQRFLVYGEQ
ncbi:hypothetical protein ANCCEY_01547 [Ancylostoma ceylanicum]|uniref:alpha-L-fucosidase n=1 Tax=Ancylostoma ceylanicum TaxID=53326 RepID=A0A0D6M7C6_9BILA|nr:hypothetical protein ANCCEY_01547 [Ancylostoma ceylanicum]